MNDLELLARRILDGVPTVESRLLVRDRCGRSDVVEAVAAECRRRGFDPTVQLRSNEHLAAILAASSPEDWSDAACDLREEFPRDIEAVVTLGGWHFDPTGLEAEVVQAWAAAVSRATAELDRRGVLTLAVAIATDEVAAALDIDREDLEDLVRSSVLLDSGSVSADASAVAARLAAVGPQTLATPGCRLDVDRGRREVLVDDGIIDDDDIQCGAVVSNLPAGSVYWTVIEERTRGDVRLADGTVLRFDESGRVAEGPYRGERISHVGIGLNGAIRDTIGWTIVDEHRRGAMFVALGENLYMGGNNESAMNVDLVPDSPTLLVDDDTIVDSGELS